jgi:hypothetical protein
MIRKQEMDKDQQARRHKPGFAVPDPVPVSGNDARGTGQRDGQPRHGPENTEGKA